MVFGFVVHPDIDITATTVIINFRNMNILVFLSNAALTGEVMLATLLRFFAAKVTILLNLFERLVKFIYAA